MTKNILLHTVLGVALGYLYIPITGIGAAYIIPWLPKHDFTRTKLNLTIIFGLFDFICTVIALVIIFSISNLIKNQRYSAKHLFPLISGFIIGVFIYSPTLNISWYYFQIFFNFVAASFTAAYILKIWR